MRGLKTAFGMLLACSLAATVTPALAADAYPNKPIRLMVGFPPGTATDTVARLIAERLGQLYKWNVIVENKPGQAGSIGATDIARSAPDGYSLLISANGPLSTNPNLFASTIRYDTRKDFTAISKVGILPMLLVVGKDAPYKTVQDLLDAAKAKPGDLNYASLGQGSTAHLIAATFATKTGTEYMHVPYKGSSETAVALISGDVDFMFDTALATLPQIEANRMRALGVSTGTRMQGMPDIPTVAESGVPGFDMAAWLGIVGPVGIPEDIVKKLNAGIHEALSSPEVIQRMRGLGSEVDLSTPEEFREFLVSEYDKWGAAIDQAGVPRQ